MLRVRTPQTVYLIPGLGKKSDTVHLLTLRPMTSHTVLFLTALPPSSNSTASKHGATVRLPEHRLKTPIRDPTSVQIGWGLPCSRSRHGQ